MNTYPRTVNLFALLSLLAVLLISGLAACGGPANAQQGWPVAGNNWDFYGGGGGRGGFRSSFSGSYTRAYSGSYSTAYPSPSAGSYYASYPSSTGESSKRRAILNLRVPADAKISFDQSRTTQTGTMRSFESPPLEDGLNYAYQVLIQWKRDGKDVTETRHVSVHAGEVVNLTLGASGN